MQALGGEGRIDVFLGVADYLLKLRHLEAILPFGFGGVDASIFEVVEVGSIETRLAVSYEDEIVVITFHLKFIFFDVAKRRFDLSCSA